MTWTDPGPARCRRCGQDFEWDGASLMICPACVQARADEHDAVPLTDKQAAFDHDINTHATRTRDPYMGDQGDETPDGDPNAWLQHLQQGFEVGYYRRDAELDSTPAPGCDTPIPWANKRCGDCPFLTKAPCGHHHCVIRWQHREQSDHTCEYFEESNRAEGEQIAAENVHEYIRPRMFGGGW